jgi:phage shock protein PspC (stress-responsive transcriptional regulator)
MAPRDSGSSLIVSAPGVPHDDPMEPVTSTRRLVRRRDDRLIAGVCSGIADHLGIDPILVRIGTVVLSFFGGVGLVAYGAAWLFVPDEGEDTSIGERAIHERRWAPIIGIGLIAVAVMSLAGRWWWIGRGAGFPLLLIAGGAYLLWIRTTPPTGVRQPRQARQTHARTEEMERPPRERRPRSRVTPVVFGALLIGAGVVGLAVANGRNVQPTAIFAGGLLIVGGGLVASAWFGRAWALIPLGLLLLAAISVSALIKVPFAGGIGERHFAPVAATELKDEYRLAVGEMRLDLSDVDLPRGARREITATVGVGHLDLTVPHDVNVQLHGASGLGDVALLGDDSHDGGISVDRDLTLDAEHEGAPTLVIDAEVGVGQVEVHRAAA